MVTEYMKRINAYIKYLEEYGNQYCNAFEVLNTSENSFSEFIAWLFDIEKVAENKEDSIQYYFIKEFMKKLWKDEQKDKKYKAFIEIKTDKDFNDFLHKFINDCTVNTQKDNMDIVITSGKFMIVIENKIAAKISAQNDHTQIENYTKINTEYNKKYVFICANKEFYPEQPLKSHIAQRDYNGECAKGKIKDLLYKFGYTILEHYDIAKILFDFLNKKYNKELFEDDILLPTEFNMMRNTINEIYNKTPQTKENTRRQIELLLEKLKSMETESPQYLLYKNLKKTTPIRSVTLPIREVLNNSINEISIVCQFIEFCELHNGEVDNFQAYTKFIKGEPVWNICERIFLKNKKEWENLKKKTNNIEELKNILNNIEDSYALTDNR